MSPAAGRSLTFFAGDGGRDVVILALIHGMEKPVTLQKTAEFLGVLCIHGTRQEAVNLIYLPKISESLATAPTPSCSS